MQTYTWYTDSPDIHSPATIHQVLAYGSLTAIHHLMKTLGKDTVSDVFLNQPQKVYTAPALHFISQFILRIPHPVDERRYLKTTPRVIG